jgi:hypothetical protein
MTFWNTELQFRLRLCGTATTTFTARVNPNGDASRTNVRHQLHESGVAANTPVFRDMNVVGFSQELRPGK